MWTSLIVQRRRKRGAFVACAVLAFSLSSGGASAAVWYVDDDAPDDPGPGQVSLSDPAEDGSQDHPFDAIQEAVDAAQAGDAIAVAPGLYQGPGNRDIRFAGKAVTLFGGSDLSGPSPARAVIDCQGSTSDPHRAFLFDGDEGPETVVDGLVVGGAVADGNGGGILCSGSASPTIRNCLLVANRASLGGAIYAADSSAPTVIHCTVVANHGQTGGGLHGAETSSPLVRNSILWANADDGEDALAAQVACPQQASVSYCCVQGYTGQPVYAWGFDEPGPAYAEGSGGLPEAVATGTVSDVGVRGNAVRMPQGVDAYVDMGSFNLPKDSGSIEMWINPDPMTTQDAYHTFSKGDDGEGPDTWAASVILGRSGDLQIMTGLTNSFHATEYGAITFGEWQHLVVAWSPSGVRFLINGQVVPNRIERGLFQAAQDPAMPVGLAKWGGTYYSGAAYRGAVDELRIYDRSLSEQEAANAYAGGLTGDPAPGLTLTGAGNLGADPLFADQTGPDGEEAAWHDNDYRLLPASPCVHAGDPAAEVSGQTDLDGDPRELLGRVDIGADEATSPTILNITQGTQHETIQAALDAAVDGDEIVLDPGVYLGQGNRDLTWNGKAVTVRSIDPNDESIVAATVIDPQREARAATFSNGEGPSAKLAGVTIRHAYAETGGAILCDGASPTIEGCVFTANLALRGGAMASANSAEPNIVRCRFASNATGLGQGGAILCTSGGGAVIADSDFNLNAAGQGGGVFIEQGGSASFLACYFYRNAASSGGAICVTDGGNADVRYCEFVHNYGYNAGGAIYLIGATASVADSLFHANNSAYFGAGVCVQTAGHLNIDRSMILWNVATGSGAGLYVAVNSSADLANCVLYRNGTDGAVNETAQIAKERQEIDGVILEGEVAIRYSYMEGWSGWLGGVGNFGGDPLLTPDGHLRADSPLIDAGDPDFTPTADSLMDWDGDDRVNGDRIDIGFDEFHDQDADGLPDWWERDYFGSTTEAEPGADVDADLASNLQEYERYGTDPNRPPLFVDAASGDDAYDGLTASWDGTHGPKATIQAAIDACQDGQTILALPGTYAGVGNRELDFNETGLALRSIDGPDATVIDCESESEAIFRNSIADAYCAIEGFTFTGGARNRGGAFELQYEALLLTDCVFAGNQADTEGGAMVLDRMDVTFDDVILGENTAPEDTADAAVIDRTHVYLAGDLRIDHGRMDVGSTWFHGPGTLRLAQGAELRISSVEGNRPTEIRSNIDGPGDVVVDAGCQLYLGEQAILDLHRQPGDTCAYAQGGRAILNGALVAQHEAVVRNTTICVNEAYFQSGNLIQSNDITLLEASSGSGGQFYVDGTSTITDNVIVSEGDRYLDLDPDPQSPTRPTITNNQISVVIKRREPADQGTLLELRALDYDAGTPVNPYASAGAFRSPTSPGFTADPSANWVLEALTIETEAKLNLTNRQGFVFQQDTTHLETAYVSELRLYPNAVLNTAYQTLYYGDLVLLDETGAEIERNPDLAQPLANGARLVNVPLLGFSLNTLRMEDDTDFETRVRSRLTNRQPLDPNDPNYQPIDPGNPETPLGAIVRRDVVVGGVETGVMEMRTLGPDPHPTADNVAAKATFDRAGEDAITITFDYLFLAEDDANLPFDPNTELVVSLSDHWDVDQSGFEVARVRPPAPGRPGSLGSDRFGSFYAVVPRGELNFSRATYVQLELRGRYARCYVDNWDPMIQCWGLCGNVDGVEGVTMSDYLVLLAEVTGQLTTQPDRTWCVDLFHDGYVDINDLLIYTEAAGTGSGWCGAPAEQQAPAGGAAEPEADDPNAPAIPNLGTSLILAGKSHAPLDENSYVYAYDPEAGPVGKWLPGVSDTARTGRLAVDTSGHLFQVHAGRGLIDPFTGEVAAAPRDDLSWNGHAVHLGITEASGGLPLLDVEAHPSDPNRFVVMPVQVTLNGTGSPIRAAAEIRLVDEGGYEVSGLYYPDPNTPSNIIPSDDALFVLPEPDYTGLREVEVDHEQQVYVLSAEAVGDNDWLMIYDGKTAPPEMTPVLLSDVLEAPTAMEISRFDDTTLYLASSLNDADAGTTRIHRFTITRDGTGRATGLAMDPDDPNRPACETITIQNMRHVMSIVEDAEGTVWVVGVMAPTFDPNGVDYPDPADGVFTQPTMASIPYGQTDPVVATDLACDDLALPLSAVFVTSSGAGSHTLTVQSNPPATGNVHVEPGLGEFPNGETVILTAAPKPFAAFQGWTIYEGNAPGDPNTAVTDANNPLTLVMTRDMYVQADFIIVCGSGLEPMALPLLICGGAVMWVGVIRRRGRRA